MEDGFLRSADLGAQHATPYSLALDTTGLSYDPAAPGDLARILATHDFAGDAPLMDSARRCLRAWRDLKLSKYSGPRPLGLAPSQQGPKIRPRVAVLGQVPRDAALRRANPDRWRVDDVIRLALHENPGAQILYRPHPEVHARLKRGQGYPKALCTLADPGEPLPDFLDGIDRAYTISSTAGLEAVLRGVPVTTLGKPFYAGWGLTDDRAEGADKGRRLTPEELFAGAYLLYPRYLAAPDGDTEAGFMAAALRIDADRAVMAHDAADKVLEPKPIKGARKLLASKYLPQNLLGIKRADLEAALAKAARHPMAAAVLGAVNPDLAQALALAASPFWPKLFFGPRRPPPETLAKCIGAVRWDRAFDPPSGPAFQEALSYTLLGAVEGDAAREALLTQIRRFLDPDVFAQLLLDVDRMYPGPYIARQTAWLLAEVGDAPAAPRALAAALKRLRQSEKDRAVAEAEGTPIPPAPPPMSEEAAALTRARAQALMDTKDFAGAGEQLRALLLAGRGGLDALNKLCTLAEYRFDSDSALAIANLTLWTRVRGLDGRSLAMYARNLSANAAGEHMPFLRFMSFAIGMHPHPTLLAQLEIIVERYKKKMFSEFWYRVLIKSLHLDNDISLKKATAYTAISDPENALRIIEETALREPWTDKHSVIYAQALAYLGRVDEAIAIVEKARRARPTLLNWSESLRLCIIAGAYTKGLALLEEAHTKKIPIGEMFYRKIYFGNRMVQRALKTLLDINVRNALKMYFMRKYFEIEKDSCGTLLALAVSGPGDEIRFASTYNLLPSLIPHRIFTLSCDPRLQRLFERSFPHIPFVPVRRLRTTDVIDPEKYGDLPGSDLIGVLDNRGMAALQEADQVALVTDFLHKALPDYDAFPGTAYLTPDADAARAWAARLPPGPLVGLSWRSSLTSYARNEHYLTIEELAPLFAIPGVQFVNLQYDDCDEELAWVQARWPGKLWNPPDLDQYNDLDGVAALMAALPLIIAPCTTVLELAGALGRPTWFFTNSSEAHWRKIDDKGTDVWHHSVTHVEGAVLGDKASLVEALAARLKNWALNQAA
jgi:capsular polysaccharide export protein